MVDFSSTPIQLFLSVSIFIGGFGLALSVRKYFGASAARASMIYLWHTLFCFVYMVYIIKNGGDALAYYRIGVSSDVSFSLGTNAVRYIVFLLTQVFGLSFLGCSLFFHIFGFIGLLAFDAALREVTWYKSRSIRLSATLIVFLPSVSFWSAGLGKDSISFLSVGLALWAALDMRRRWHLIVISVLAMLLVRPHMAGLLGIGLAGSYVFQRGVPITQRFLLGAVALAASAVLVPLGLNYAGLGDQAGADDLIEYVENRQGMNLGGGSSVDIASMNIFMKLFTYMFRPMFVDADGVAGLAASLDNIILLIFFIVGGWAVIKNRLPVRLNEHNRMFLWIYSGVAWVTLALVTANLGIALRQKWMFVPMLVFLLISVIGRSRSDEPNARVGSRT